MSCKFAALSTWSWGNQDSRGGSNFIVDATILLSQLAGWELFPHTDLWFRTTVGSLLLPRVPGIELCVLWMLKYYVGKRFVSENMPEKHHRALFLSQCWL